VIPLLYWHALAPAAGISVRSGMMIFTVALRAPIVSASQRGHHVAGSIGQAG
jgi:hypothetical protein